MEPKPSLTRARHHPAFNCRTSGLQDSTWILEGEFHSFLSGEAFQCYAAAGHQLPAFPDELIQCLVRALGVMVEEGQAPRPRPQRELQRVVRRRVAPAH